MNWGITDYLFVGGGGGDKLLQNVTFVGESGSEQTSTNLFSVHVTFTTKTLVKE